MMRSVMSWLAVKANRPASIAGTGTIDAVTRRGFALGALFSAAGFRHVAEAAAYSRRAEAACLGPWESGMCQDCSSENGGLCGPDCEAAGGFCPSGGTCWCGANGGLCCDCYCALWGEPWYLGYGCFCYFPDYTCTLECDQYQP